MRQNPLPLKMKCFLPKNISHYPTLTTTKPCVFEAL